MVGLAQGKSLRSIAKELNRSVGTIQKEVKRNAPHFQVYSASMAQVRYERRTKRQRSKAPLKSPGIYIYVREHLRMGLSPEAISGRLQLVKSEHIGTETIYEYIYRNKREKLWRYLKLGRKKRMKKGLRRVRKGRIAEAVSIDVRPRKINGRKEVGHWESDLMEGKKSGPVVSATVERTTRYLLLTKLSSKGSVSKVGSLVEQLGALPKQAVKTLTLDNGKENTDHQQMTKRLGLSVYFCHAYHSWEKGTVENSIGRVRRYIPKGTDLNTVTKEALYQIQEQMNHTPRKCLGYFTPYEKMREYLDSLSG